MKKNSYIFEVWKNGRVVYVQVFDNIQDATSRLIFNAVLLEHDTNFSLKIYCR